MRDFPLIFFRYKECRSKANLCDYLLHNKSAYRYDRIIVSINTRMQLADLVGAKTAPFQKHMRKGLTTKENAAIKLKRLSGEDK